MESPLLASIVAHYEWKLSLIAMVAIFATSFLGGKLFALVPTIGAAVKLNADTLATKMQKPNYAANQKWNRKWGAIFQVVIFALILPFCITPQVHSASQMLIDMVVILMVYDFFYYLTHRFLFHDSAFFGGPLKWMHAYHHRQHNPCRWDSSYIHPLEVALGLGLYVGTTALLSVFMGRFDVPTIVITFVAFSQINLHNHNRWTEDRFPWRYLAFLSRMHHNHHAKFTGGNFATISLLYDWMFGTLDDGKAYYGLGKPRPSAAKALT